MSRTVELTLLTQPHCTFCDRAKEILDRVGREYPLQVREVDLASAEGQRLAATVGALFAPGVLIDGEAFSYGRLSERKLRRALDRRSDAYVARQPAEPARSGGLTGRVMGDPDV